MRIAFVNLYNTIDQPPLAFAYMANYLKKYGDYHEIRIIESDLKNAVVDLVKFRPDVIGFSSTSLFYQDVIRLARRIREIPPLRNAVIVLGGAHLTALPGSLDPVFDVGVVGEGEQTLLELVNMIKKKGIPLDKKGLGKIAGIVFFNNEEIVFTAPRGLIEPLDMIPMPAWELIDHKYFRKNIVFTNKPEVSLPIISSRGCPFKCIFCNSSFIWKKVRFHSAKRVAEEIEFLVRRYNAKIIQAEDDLFSINKQRLRDLIEELRYRRILGRVEFSCMARTDTLDDEVMQLLKTLNVKRLNFGFESGNNRVLNYLKGGRISIDDHKRAIALCKKYRIKVRGSLIFGSPTESISEMKETLRFMDYMWKRGVELVWFHVMTPFPNTKIWDIAKERRKVSDNMDWERLSLFNPDEPLLLDSNIPVSRFRQIFLKARAKSRRFEIRYWFEKLTHNPLETMSYLFSGMRFAKFFIAKKRF